MRPRTAALCLTADAVLVEVIVARLETHAGIDPGAVLRGAEVRLEGIRRKGLAVDGETVLWAVDATLDDLWASQCCGPLPGEDSRS